MSVGRKIKLWTPKEKRVVKALRIETLCVVPKLQLVGTQIAQTIPHERELGEAS